MPISTLLSIDAGEMVDGKIILLLFYARLHQVIE
jgi:hypothetical protein